MIRRPPISTRTDTLFPYTTLFRSVVADVAVANGGRYSVDLHLRHDPSATQAFAATHVRRLEAMRRGGAGVEREAGGSWAIPADHIDRAAAYHARSHPDQPVDVETSSPRPPDQLRDADPATCVHRQPLPRAPLPVPDPRSRRRRRAYLAD